MSKINIKTSIKQNDKIQEEIETKGILQDNKIKYVNDKIVTTLDINRQIIKRTSEDYKIEINLKDELIKTEYLNIKIKLIDKTIEQNKIQLKYKIIDTKDIFEYEIIWR